MTCITKKINYTPPTKTTVNFIPAVGIYLHHTLTSVDTILLVPRILLMQGVRRD